MSSTRKKQSKDTKPVNATETTAPIEPKQDESKPKTFRNRGADKMERINIWITPQDRAWVEQHLLDQQPKYTTVSHFLRVLIEQERRRFPDDDPT